MRAQINGVTVEGTVAELRELLGVGAPASVPVSVPVSVPASPVPASVPASVPVAAPAPTPPGGGGPTVGTVDVTTLLTRLDLRDEERVALLRMALGQAPELPAGPTTALPAPVSAPAAPGLSLPDGKVPNNVLRYATRERVAGDGTGRKAGASTGAAPAFEGFDPQVLIAEAARGEQLEKARAGAPRPERPAAPRDPSRRDRHPGGGRR